MQHKNPVLFLFFNRANEALQTFSKIKEYQPEILYLSSDGPRASKAGEAELVLELRQKIEEMIDWPVEIRRLYSTSNEGCAQKVSSAITTALAECGKLIVLEDDCCPCMEFFRFVDWGLKTYNDDERVGAITGTRMDGRVSKFPFFSAIPQIWGWALWERAWKDYSLEFMNTLPEIKCSLESSSIDKRCRKDWMLLVDKMRENPYYTWDYQFIANFIRLRLLCLVPGGNLISNIGYGDNATHTHTKLSRFADMKTSQWELTDAPDKVINNKKYSTFLQRNYFFLKITLSSTLFRIKRQIKLRISKT